MKRRIIIIAAIVIVAWGIYFLATRKPREIVITGIVTTEDVIVSPQVQGQLVKLYVDEGVEVKQGQLLGTIRPQQWEDDLSYFTNAEKQAAAQVGQAKANLDNVRLNFQREDDLYNKKVESKQNWDQARTAQDAAQAQYDAAQKQLDAAHAQTLKARTQLNYTEILAPIDGVVDFRAAREGEVVNMGQGIVTLINEDDLWVRADVEETYIDRIRLHDRMTVRLPSGIERAGEVIFRGVDADYATQRDVSRTKRDIKTFEVRLRCDNKDRKLAVGMTAYVILPLNK